jgi:predicted ATPase
MVGRAPQVQALRDSFDRVRRGAATTVFVQGPSGAGKSHLVRHFLREARSVPDAVILSGRCYEDESVPYKGVDGLIDALGRFLATLSAQDRAVVAPRDSQALTRVFPVLREFAELSAGHRPEAEVPDAQELRRRAFRGLRDLLARVGDRRPLVLHVDDLQWGDADSAALLADLVRPPDAPVLLLLGAYRSEYVDSSACLRTLREKSGAAADGATLTVDVGPLDSAEALALAVALLGPGSADAEARAARIVHGSGGIPFFIHELARHAADGTEIEAAEAASDLDRVIRRRVDELPAAAREVLEVVAVCGHPLTRHALAAATQADRATLRLLRTGHFIRTTGADEHDSVEPYHDRIREAVAGRLDAAVAQSHHRRLAAGLEQSGAVDAETLALHFDGGGLVDRAGFYYTRAADAASEMLAFERASKLYARALDLHTARGWPTRSPTAAAVRRRRGSTSRRPPTRPPPTRWICGARRPTSTA